MTVAIPTWPDPKSAAGALFFDRAGQCFQAWKAHGVSDAFACAMVANAEAESSFDPAAKGDHVNGLPTAFGIYQEHADRLNAIKAGTGIDIKAAPAIWRQVTAAMWELETYPYFGFAKIAAASTASAAAIAACAFFERAGAADAAIRRGQMAQRWSEYFAKEGR